MKTVVTTALSVFTLAVFMQVQGIATEPSAELVEAPSPTQPEHWNVWGQAELDGLVWTVQPVQCNADQAGLLCVEVAVHNPSFNVVTATQRIRVMANDSQPMARMPSIPSQVEAKDVTLQAAGGATVRQVVTFAVSGVTANQLELRIGGTDADLISGQTVAVFSSFVFGELGMLDLE